MHWRLSGSDTNYWRTKFSSAGPWIPFRYQCSAPSLATEAKLLNLLSKIVVTEFFGNLRSRNRAKGMTIRAGKIFLSFLMLTLPGAHRDIGSLYTRSRRLLGGFKHLRFGY